MRKMMMVLLAAGCLGATALRAAEPPPKGHPDSSAWKNLFAPDLSNANYPKGIWFVADGALTASKDEAIWTKKDYENFVMDLEFKNAPRANSGVLIYATDTANWIPNSVEVQILDDWADEWVRQPATWKCAGIFGRLAPAKQVVKKAGEWNRMTIWARGPQIDVMLNGELVTQCDMRQWNDAQKNPDGSAIPPWLNRPLATMATKGKIGLQGKHGGAPIYFRNIKIKALE